MLNQTMSSLDVVHAAPETIAKTHQRMIDAQPPYYRDSPQMNAVIGGQAAEIEQRRAEARDLLDQMTISKATWSLEMYETIFDVKYNPSKTIKDRQDVIRAKMRGAAPTTLKVIRDVINSFVPAQNGTARMDNPNYYLYAEIPAGEGIDLGAIVEAVSEIKPAHIVFEPQLHQTDSLPLYYQAYSYEVTFPICGEFGCAEIEGKEVRTKLEARFDAYGFDVLYPITNNFLAGEV